MRHTRTILLVLAAAALLAQCAPEPATPAARKALRIGIDLWAGYYPLVLAQELGYLKAANVQVEIVAPQNTDRMLAEFAARDYDAVCVSFADMIPVTRAVSNLRIVLVSDESAGADQILAREPITGPEHLRGKRIGTNLGGFGEIFVRRLLARHAVSVAEVELVNVDGSKVPDLLSRGLIDIGHTWEPYASEARRRGMQSTFTSQDTPGLIRDGMIFRADTVESRAEEVKALVAAWFRAVEWWRENPEEGDQHIEKRLRLLPGEARPHGIDILDAADNRALMSAAEGGVPPLVGGLQEIVEFFVARGLLLERPDPLRLLHLDQNP